MKNPSIVRQQPEVGKQVRAFFPQEIRAIDEKERTIEFVASTEAVDRYGDIIRVAGWETANYMQNPVFLWGHRSGDPPIGKCVKLTRESNPPALVQRIQFADKETYPFADTVYNLYRGKFLRAVSVGFMPLERPKRIKNEQDETTGYEFTKQELLELSAVPIPANQEALARAVSKGVVTDAEVRSFEALVTKCGEKNPPWSFLSPGVTYAVDGGKGAKQDEPGEPPEDEPAGSPADTAEELGECLDECAANCAEAQKLCAVLISQLEGGDSEIAPAGEHRSAAAPGSVSSILSRVIESKRNIDNLSRSVAQGADLADATARINELRKILGEQVAMLTVIRDASATHEEMKEIGSRFEEVRQRLEKMAAEGAKASGHSDIVTRIDEVRNRADKIISGAVKKSDVSEVSTKVDAVRSVAESISSSCARSADVRDVSTRVDGVRSMLESSAASGSAEIAGVSSRVTEVRQQLENMSTAVALEATVSDVVMTLGEVRKRLEDFAATAPTKEYIDQQVARVDGLCESVNVLVEEFRALDKFIREQVGKETVERSVCPYVDDPIAPKGTAWDATAEMAKQTTPAGWKRMCTVITGDPANKGSYKLPHHQGGGFKVVPNGVRAALGRLASTQMASADRAGARAHLMRHQKKISAQTGFEMDFDAFEARLAALGDAYIAAEAAGLADQAKAIDAEIQAHVATLDPQQPKKPEKITTAAELLSALVKN